MIEALVNKLFADTTSTITAFVGSDGFFVVSSLIALFLIVKGAQIIVELLNGAASGAPAESDSEVEPEGERKLMR